MRKWICAAALILTGCGDVVPVPSESHAPTPKAFTFRGLVPGVTGLAEAQKAGIVENCRDLDEMISCNFVEHRVGSVPVDLSDVVFVNGRFDWFSINPTPEDYETLLALMTSIYGDPCQTKSTPMQNAYGAKFSGDETRWCFADGSLTLRRHSNQADNLRQGDLDFFTAHPEEASAPVTYNAGNV